MHPPLDKEVFDVVYLSCNPQATAAERQVINTRNSLSKRCLPKNITSYKQNLNRLSTVLSTVFRAPDSGPDRDSAARPGYSPAGITGSSFLPPLPQPKSRPPNCRPPNCRPPKIRRQKTDSPKTISRKQSGFPLPPRPFPARASTPFPFLGSLPGPSRPLPSPFLTTLRPFRPPSTRSRSPQPKAKILFPFP